MITLDIGTNYLFSGVTVQSVQQRWPRSRLQPGLLEGCTVHLIKAETGLKWKDFLQAISVPGFTSGLVLQTVVPALRPKPSPFDFQRLRFVEAVMRKSYIVKDVFPLSL